MNLPARLNRAGVLVVLVTGGRTFDDVDHDLHIQLACVLDLCTKAHIRMAVVQGGAKGADAAARDWAMENHIHLYNEQARWAENGRAAGPIRNQLMIDKHHPDICIAAPGGAGTADMVARCHAAKIPVYNLKGETHGGH